MAMLAELFDGVIGLDTHRDTLTAAAVTQVGGVLAQTTTTSADAAGYQHLLGFACSTVPGRRVWAVEGAGSFGAGLAVFLQQRGEHLRRQAGRRTAVALPIWAGGLRVPGQRGWLPAGRAGKATGEASRLRRNARCP
jgi:hypothetical protein